MAIIENLVPSAGKVPRENDVKKSNTREKQIARRIQLSACATCIVAAFTVSSPQPAHARNITPPAVPFDLQVDLAENEAFLEGNARRHPELHLPTHRRWLPVYALHAGGHAVRQR